eukprot:CAMPEP_0119134458 /NCGR_PEP_ID=MMETSP1310-20130426/16931_1 /TAXON_ID=464262 /ORGANISM="Genus nov. species nov., Strain RCC2339" /LENGTH=212 /DNA_ID=CAMNT_0007125251 /DNA_START=245 /DNA_END=883 /DNA_ORIENTATION=+
MDDLEPIPFPATLYYEYTVDSETGCLGYNVVFGMRLPDIVDPKPTRGFLSVWGLRANNATAVGSIVRADISLPVNLITLPTETEPVTFGEIELALFADRAVTTGSGETSIHVVVNVYPPSGRLVGFITNLTCDAEPVPSQAEPSQFEHVFDVDAKGRYLSRYNLSWLLTNVACPTSACTTIGYNVLFAAENGATGSLPYRSLPVVSYASSES